MRATEDMTLEERLTELEERVALLENRNRRLGPQTPSEDYYDKPITDLVSKIALERKKS